VLLCDLATTDVDVVVRALEPGDADVVSGLLHASWGGPVVVSRGRTHDASALPGFIAERDGVPAGLVTYDVTGGDCEVVTIDAVDRRRGVGSALLQATAAVARAAGCRRLWLITTNDNIDALRFYLRNGLRLVAVHVDALDRSRALKPSIPLIGKDGVPLRDEWELELLL
jgi:ribosomal protein S18 acetylase RimI-like enzyme